MNQVVLVGKIVDFELEEDNLNGCLTISVSKPYKNDKGIYETTHIPCRVIGNMVNVTQEHCKKDNIVGIKGSIENKEDKLYVMTEKLSLLKSS